MHGFRSNAPVARARQGAARPTARQENAAMQTSATPSVTDI